MPTANPGGGRAQACHHNHTLIIEKGVNMANRIVYTDIKEKAVCCGKIYVSDVPIKNFKCKNCGNTLVAAKLPYVIKCEKVKE